MLRDEHGVDHEGREVRLLERLRDGLDDPRVGEHAGLHRVDTDVGGDGADLRADRLGRDRLEALDAARVLDRHRRDRGHPVNAERAERLEIRLDAGAPARV